MSPCTKIVNRTTAYVSISIRDLTSPISSGRLRARAILSPPLKPPQVIILAVFSSKSLNLERKTIGTDTPMYLDRTTKTIVITDNVR